MKKIYCLMLFCSSLLGIQSFAQPVLDSSDISPNIGDIIWVNSIDATGLSPGNAGVNQTWDFSGVVSPGLVSVEFLDPANTPAGSSFPNASIAALLQGAYDYYESTSSSYSRVGADNSAQVIEYLNPQMQLTFPMGYQTMFSDSFIAEIPGIVPIFRRGTITAEADGYGTLTTPEQTFTNALRIKYVEVYQDEINGNPATQYNSEIYVWYVAGVHYPIFSISSLTIGGAGTTTFGSYIDDITLSSFSPQVLVNDLEIFPNPASSSVTVQGEMTKSGPFTVSLMNATGQLVRRFEAKMLGATTFQQVYDIEGLAPGIYLLRMATSNQQQVSRLMIE